MIKNKNKISAFIEYMQDSGIHDELLLYMTIKGSVESYFGKSVYISDDFEMFFSENDKKISISKELSHLLVKDLKSMRIKNENKRENTPVFLFLNRVISAKVIKITKSGYLLVDEHDNSCFLQKSNNYSFSVGEKSYFFVYKVEKNILKLRINNIVAEHVINMLLTERKAVVVDKWKKGSLLVFSYGYGDKLGKDNLNRLRYFFKNEKIIFNQRS